MQRWTSLRAMYARQRRNCSTTPSGAGTAENVNLSPVFKAIHRFLAGVYLPRKYDKGVFIFNCTIFIELNFIYRTVNSSFKKIGKISSTPPTTETDLEYVQLVENNCSNSTLLSKVLHVDVTGTETLSNFSPIPCSSSSTPNSGSEKYNVRPPKRCKSQATEETLKQSAENIDNLINKITNTLTEETQEEKAMCTVILHAVRHLQDSTFY